MSHVGETTSDLALICAEADIPGDGAIFSRVVNGKNIALARNPNAQTGVVAFSAQCPHMQAPFRFGRVVNGEVICPWHFFRFDTETGSTAQCESIMKLDTYPVRIADGNVYVEVRKQEQ